MRCATRSKLALYAAVQRRQSRSAEWIDYVESHDLLAAGRGGDAVALFMALVGAPAEQVEGMRQAPVWPMFEAVGPTLAYDAAAIGEDRSVPTGRAAKVTVPTLIMNGDASFAFMGDKQPRWHKRSPTRSIVYSKVRHTM